MTTRRSAVVGSAIFVLAATIALAPAAAAAPSCQLPIFGPGSSYRPVIDPAKFAPTVDNPYFPLKPGTTFIYSGVKDTQKAIDIFAPSTQTRVIDGVTTRVVLDRLLLNGVLAERTTDYYAQDVCGNVWYFGEDTAQLDSHGHVTGTAGSFHAGIDGAQPGVFMQATPQLGHQFRQEWYRGQAEDTFQATNLSVPITVPFGRFRHALRTAETTALEPGVLDNKDYVAGIGEVLETTVVGPTETLSLVDVLS